jgi:hypothetical protein
VRHPPASRLFNDEFVSRHHELSWHTPKETKWPDTNVCFAQPSGYFRSLGVCRLTGNERTDVMPNGFHSQRTLQPPTLTYKVKSSDGKFLRIAVRTPEA